MIRDPGSSCMQKSRPDFCGPVKAVHYDFVTNENETSFVFVFCIHHRQNWPQDGRRNLIINFTNLEQVGMTTFIHFENEGDRKLRCSQTHIGKQGVGTFRNLLLERGVREHIRTFGTYRALVIDLLGRSQVGMLSTDWLL